MKSIKMCIHLLDIFGMFLELRSCINNIITSRRDKGARRYFKVQTSKIQLILNYY